MDTHLPLTGVRVVDRTDGLGEMTSRLLADLGADVIRVEPTGGAASRNDALYYATHNANKRAVALDTTDDAYRRLLAGADILITNQHEEHPGLVVVAITDYGLTGPYAGWQATEWTHLALGGVLCRSGLPGREPLLPPGSIAYESASAQAAWAALIAYWNKLETGAGDLVDVSVYESTARVFDPGFGIGGSATGGVPAVDGPRGRPDARHLYPIFPCADGWVRICVLAPRQWQGMFTWLGSPAEFADPELAKLGKRFAAAGAIYPAIGRLFATRTREQIVAEGQQHGVPTAALLSPTEVLSAEQFAAREAFTSIGGVTMPNGFVEVDGVRAGVRTAAPSHGEHNGEVLAELSDIPDISVMSPGPRRPLRGLRVLDLGVIVVGAELGRLFADMGAEVIKVENQAFPDGSRQTFDGSPISASFAYGHRNKLGLGLNLRSDEGRDLFKQLVAVSDVVLSNFKPGTLESLGLGYDALSQVNPGIIVADSSAFGPTGPWSRRLGYGPLVRASAGLSGLWRYRDDAAGYSDASTIYPDHVAARYEAVAILAKLIARRRDGRGGTVSVSQAEIILGQLSHQLARESIQPGSLAPVGNEGAGDAPRGIYPCAGDDEWLVVTVRGDTDWRRLSLVLGIDLDLPTASDRIAHRDRIDAAVREWTGRRAPRQAMTELQAAGVPAAMMQRVPELLDDPHLTHRGFFRTMHHPRITGPMPAENTPAIFRYVEEPELKPAPVMGEHSRDVLIRILGLREEQADALITADVVQQFS
ncbi:putative CoA-transferase [Actinoplanes sp. OR16]|uniref:CaiB/BaiF CoA-transferase family protein n=1 Tax=Actinoplanes sp. OR16 TaxID=946334 RepID=UPI000F6B72BF|nr:CoA transferase [Actinoplanes sp. OR16]BBH70047.1 putative CoA-transferase [Actinoplanes sp. OR16]